MMARQTALAALYAAAVVMGYWLLHAAHDARQGTPGAPLAVSGEAAP